jgi:DNA-binding transcriptional MerR regulator
MSKEENDNQLLPIRKFARLSGLKQSTLRYFDDIGLFKPAVRKDNGYRYYLPQQLITISTIRAFTDFDVTVKAVSEVTAARTPDSILKFMVGREIDLEDRIATLASELKVARVFKHTIHRGMSVDEGKISVEYLNELSLSIGPVNEFPESGSFHKPFMNFLSVAKEHRINLNYPIGGIFGDMDEFDNHPNAPTNFFSIDPDGLNRRPAGNYITAFKRGYYGNVGDIPEKIREFAEKEDLVFKGPVYNIYLLDEVSEIDPDNYLLEISVRVTPKAQVQGQESSREERD